MQPVPTDRLAPYLAGTGSYFFSMTRKLSVVSPTLVTSCQGFGGLL